LTGLPFLVAPKFPLWNVEGNYNVAHLSTVIQDGSGISEKVTSNSTGKLILPGFLIEKALKFHPTSLTF
jgi:hypothetical protein